MPRKKKKSSKTEELILFSDTHISKFTGLFHQEAFENGAILINKRLKKNPNAILNLLSQSDPNLESIKKKSEEISNLQKNIKEQKTEYNKHELISGKKLQIEKSNSEIRDLENQILKENKQFEKIDSSLDETIEKIKQHLSKINVELTTPK